MRTCWVFLLLATTLVAATSATSILRAEADAIGKEDNQDDVKEHDTIVLSQDVAIKEPERKKFDEKEETENEAIALAEEGLGEGEVEDEEHGAMESSKDIPLDKELIDDEEGAEDDFGNHDSDDHIVAGHDDTLVIAPEHVEKMKEPGMQRLARQLNHFHGRQLFHMNEAIRNAIDRAENGNGKNDDTLLDDPEPEERAVRRRKRVRRRNNKNQLNRINQNRHVANRRNVRRRNQSNSNTIRRTNKRNVKRSKQKKRNNKKSSSAKRSQKSKKRRLSSPKKGKKTRKSAKKSKKNKNRNGDSGNKKRRSKKQRTNKAKRSKIVKKTSDDEAHASSNDNPQKGEQTAQQPLQAAEIPAAVAA